MAISADKRPVENGFPDGLRASLAVVCAALALLVAWCVIQLPGIGAGGGASVVAQSQELLANDLARATTDSIGEIAADLSTAAALYSVHPDSGPAATVAAFTRSCPGARGLALIRRSSGTLLAATGAPVPVDSLPDKGISQLTVSIVRDQSGATVVLTAAPIENTTGSWWCRRTCGCRAPRWPVRPPRSCC